MATSLTTAKRVALALPWLVVLLLAGWAIGRQFELSGDQRKFMPPRLGKRRAAKPTAAAAAGKGTATLVFTAWIA